MSVLVVHDYRGREVVLTEERWAHIRQRHAALAGSPTTIGTVVTSPQRVTRDHVEHQVENHYGAWRGRVLLKVCVRYRPVPDPDDPRRTAWRGEILTAHPTERVKTKEEPLWP